MPLHRNAAVLALVLASSACSNATAPATPPDTGNGTIAPTVSLAAKGNAQGNNQGGNSQGGGPKSPGPATTTTTPPPKTVTGTAPSSTTPVVDTGATTTALPVKLASWAPPLETYDTVFTVVQGKASSDTLYFKKTSSVPLRMPYVVLNIPANAQFVDAEGKYVQPGTIVKLSVHADSQYVSFEFGPHGSQFAQTPATLRVSWAFTDLTSRLPSSLSMSYQPETGTAWSTISSTVDFQLYWLECKLGHFSNYRIAY